MGHVIAPGTASVKRCRSNAINADPMSFQPLQARSMPRTLRRHPWVRLTIPSSSGPVTAPSPRSVPACTS